MIEWLGSLRRNRRLLLGLVGRDLQARYVGSAMGFFWSIVFPFLNLLVYMFVFRMVLGVRFSDAASPGQTALWMLCGITIWQAFGETISRSTNALVDNQNLIQKVVFPSEILPAYLALSALVNMAIGVAIVLLGVAWFVWISPEDGASSTEAAQRALASGDPSHALRFGPTLLLVPFLALLQAAFTIGLGTLLAAFNLFLRDVYHLIGVFVTVWMFATPIFYPPELVEKKGYGWMLDWNPMYWIIDAWRGALLFGEWPDWAGILRFALVALAALFLGTAFFMRQKPRFPDLL